MQVSRHAARRAPWQLAAPRPPRRKQLLAIVLAPEQPPSCIISRGLAGTRLLLATDTAGAPSTAAASGAVAPGQATKEEKSSQAEKAPEKKEGMGWGLFFLYIFGGIGGVTFFYYFYKAEYSPSKTEVLMLQAFRRLPFYWPPEPKAAAQNSEIRAEGLPQEFVVAFIEWFILIDLQQSDGVTRDDVLELLQDFGVHEEDKVCRPIVRRYLEFGDGQLEERRRLTCVGLQESITFLAELFHAPLPKPEKKKSADEEAAPEEPLVLPREHMGQEAVEMLRKKVRGMSSTSSGATALRQAMQMPGAMSSPAAGMLQAGASTGTMGIASSAQRPTLAPPVEDSEVDEVQEMQSEVARLDRMEAQMMGKLERMGALSPAEESRLVDVRQQREVLAAKLAQTMK